MKLIKIFFIFFSIMYFLGCSKSVEYKNEVLQAELKEELNDSNNPVLKKPAIEIVKINSKNFTIEKNVIPDNEIIKRIKILGAPLNDVVSLLAEATDQDILLQLQSNAILGATESGGVGLNNVGTNNNVGLNQNNNSNNNQNNQDQDFEESRIYISASNIGFGRLLKKTVGDKISIKYDDGTYYLGYYKTITMKIPSIEGLADNLKKTLRILGGVNVVHDSVTSSITFSTREKEYIDIMKYLKVLRDNLYVIEYDIAIYTVDLKDEYKLGIDWNIIYKSDDITAFAKTATNIGASASSGTFGAIFSSDDITGSAIANALEQFGKVESIQRPRLIGMAGTDVTFTDGLEEPYIKELATTAVGDSGVQTSTVSATALSGLEVILNSNIMDETVITNISLKINDIVGYTSFSVGESTYNQPKVHTKDIKNTMRVQPGVPIVISGLFRHKRDKGYKGIPGVSETSAKLFGATEYEMDTKTEMVIIVTPRIIKYVMK